MTVHTWSKTANSNASADSTINIPEGMSPGTVNDGMRAMMAAIAKWRDDQAGNLVTAGTADILTLTTNQGFTSLSDGLSVTARMNVTANADATLNVDGLGSKQILLDAAPTDIDANRVLANRIYKFTYDSTADGWLVAAALINEDQFSGVSSQAGAPATTPSKVGDINVDTTNDDAYVATGTASSADWDRIITAVTGVEIAAAQTLTNKTLTAPAIDVGSDATGDIYYRTDGGLFQRLALGSTDQILKVSGGLPSWANESTFRLATEVSASGKSVDFTGIPSGVNVIYAMAVDISISGNDDPILRIGDSGGFETTGYQSFANRFDTSPNGDATTIGFLMVNDTTAANNYTIHMTLTRFSGNKWVCAVSGYDKSGRSIIGCGDKELSGELTRLRFTSLTAAFDFDNGSFNISYM